MRRVVLTDASAVEVGQRFGLTTDDVFTSREVYRQARRFVGSVESELSWYAISHDRTDDLLNQLVGGRWFLNTIFDEDLRYPVMITGSTQRRDLAWRLCDYAVAGGLRHEGAPRSCLMRAIGAALRGRELIDEGEGLTVMDATLPPLASGGPSREVRS